MSEVKMDQEYNEDVEQKFGVQRDAMEDEEDDTQIVEDEIPPPQMDFFDEIADEENTQIMADEILQITPIEQRSAVDCDESVKPKSKWSLPSYNF
ncbi:uncharacterized protein LOC135695784 isoform X2 [Rhopilema esculentum]|uniref:uncharacterized protein LOC135695784 isoform X2 n=1 Tax=Rhopilema esculentum TaxID=499914 RepID=UPI0031D081D1